MGGSTLPNMTFQVYNPSGKLDLTRMPSPRVADLNGKRIGLQWNGVFRGEVTFPFLKQLLKERFPDSAIIDYDELPRQPTDPDAIGQAAKRKRCDAVICGNGG